MDSGTPHISQQENDNLDFERYLSLFLSNWYWFAISLFIALTMGYVINRYSPKIFSVSSTLLINDDQKGGMNPIASNVIPGGDIFRNQQNLRNEMEILRSYQINLRVMKDLESFHVEYVGIGRRGIIESIRYDDCPFIVVYDSLELQPKGTKIGITILDEDSYRIDFIGKTDLNEVRKFGERFSASGFDFIIERRFADRQAFNGNKSHSFFFIFKDPRVLANQYRSKLSVVPRDKEGSLVNLTVSGFVPRQEMDYLNRLMDVYVDYGLEYKRLMAGKTIQFINQQLEVISDSLDVAARELERFRTDNRVIDVESEFSIVQSRLYNSNIEKAAAELKLKYYNYLLKYLDENSEEAIISPSLIGIDDQYLVRLIFDLTALYKEKEDLIFRLGDDLPEIGNIDKQILRTHEALRENIRNCKASIYIEMNEIERKRVLNEENVMKLPSLERRFVNIRRQFDLNNTIYTYLLEKRAEAGIAEASTMADNRVIDYAQMRGQIKPQTSRNYSIALIFGILVPGILITMIDFFNRRVIDRKDVYKRTRVPIIGYISHSDSLNEIAVIEKPGSSISESFRSVRTAIRFYVKENEKAVILVSSTISSEGKTFIAINLAAIMAMLDKKVLLIALDLRKPRINRIFEHEKSPGMSTFLSRNCSYDEVIKKTQVENLYYAPSGPIPPNPAELIDTAQMAVFMEKARQEYDFIIIDTPPVAIVTDGLLLGKYADINLFIVRQRYTTLNTLEVIENLRSKGDLRNMAIILNDISLSGYYGYGLRYGYGRGYGYTYGASYYNSSYYGKYGKGSGSGGYYTEE